MVKLHVYTYMYMYRYVAMDLIPILSGLHPLAHNAQYSLVATGEYTICIIDIHMYSTLQIQGKKCFTCQTNAKHVYAKRKMYVHVHVYTMPNVFAGNALCDTDRD